MNDSKHPDLQIGFSLEHCLLPEELEIIRQSMRVVSYQKHEVIFRQNTPTSHIMFVKSGLIKIYKEGRIKRVFTLKIASPGEFIGLMSVYGDEMYQFSGSAVLPAEIGYISRQVFNDIIVKNNKFAFKEE